MLVVCPTCARVHSAKPAHRADRPTLLCSCGTPIVVPPDPHEGFAHKLRDQLGERLACGLAGACVFGGFWVFLQGGQLWIWPSVGALCGFAVGALLGDKLLAFLGIR
jgi:hypothetical protein